MIVYMKYDFWRIFKKSSPMRLIDLQLRPWQLNEPSLTEILKGFEDDFFGSYIINKGSQRLFRPGDWISESCFFSLPRTCLYLDCLPIFNEYRNCSYFPVGSEEGNNGYVIVDYGRTFSILPEPTLFLAHPIVS